MNQDYKLNSVVMMKKGHPCGENRWKIIRVGADIKIQCLKCDRVVMISRVDFNKKLKKVISYED